MPTTIGEAMRRITSEAVPCPYMMGKRPVMMAAAVMVMGQIPSFEANREKLSASADSHDIN